MRRLSPLSLASLMAIGCSQDPPPPAPAGPPPEPGSYTDHTANVLVDTTSEGFTVETCWLDGNTFRLEGRNEEGGVLEAVVEVEDDGKTAIFESTGLFVTSVEGSETTARSAFGDDAWVDRGGSGDAPGKVLNARINGPLVQVAGRIAVVDEDEQATDDDLVSFSLDAFCDEEIPPAP